MLTFLDHKGNEIGALTTFKYTNSVNGERSLSGAVHGNLEIEKGWGVRFEDEYYKVIYAKPKSLGKINIVQFDAVHQFFWDFDKSSVYSELDGSYPFQTFLDHIFNGSGYRYNLEVEVGSLRKQNFGLKKRLELFNDLIKHAGVEFQVRGKVVRILERTGTDLSTVVRKKLNLNDLSIEKRIGDFITYQKGLGAWHDENDHSKGRLEVEYVSPLATIYGRLEGEPYIDERFTIAKNFLEVLKKTVEDSYSISVQLAMEDLQKAGYRYTKPLAGDYITVIDEDINFKERVRIVSFETKYDVKGQVIDHTVTCNDIGSVKKQSVGYSSLKSSVANVLKETESAIQTANRALVSADGKKTVYFGAEFPQDIPKGTLTKGDTLYLEVGDTTKTYYWNGAEWLEPPVVNDVEAFKESINTEIAQVNQSMQAQSEEHDRQVADILSKTQSVEELANQAKTDAASAITQALQSKNEAIADARAQVSTVSQALNTAKTDLQNQVNAVDAKAVKVQSDANALRTDLNQQAQTLLSQAQAQTALTNRVASVETLADGTRSTVTELSKTVNKATGDIASVTSRTKTVEDTLGQTRTQYEALTQTVNAQTGQIDSINRKTADLQSGIDGMTERFENLRVGARNYAEDYDFSRGLWEYSQGDSSDTDRSTDNGIYTLTTTTNTWHQLQIHSESGGRLGGKKDSTALLELEVGETYTLSVEVKANSGSPKFWLELRDNGLSNYNGVVTHLGGSRNVISATSEWVRYSVTGTVKPNSDFGHRRIILGYSEIGSVSFRKVELSRGTKPMDTGPAVEDTEGKVETLRSEVGTYIRNASENSAELSRRIETVDGKAVDAKTYAQQTAEGFKTRLESLETYKNEEGTRASQYLTASRTETAKQITAERTSIASNYVAKSTYDENVRGTTLKLNEIKTTADTAKQNLATYQNTVDRKLEELTSSTQTLDGKINTASAKVDTVAGQIRTEISEVEGKIPTSIGGRNLFKGSRDFSGVWYNAGNGSFFEDYKDVHIHRTKTAWLGKSQRISVKSGEIYTFSFYAKSDSGNDGVMFYLSHSETGTPAQGHPNNKYIAISTDYQRYSITIKIASDGIIVPRLERTNTTNFLFFGGFKLETGAIPTDWSPAPEDVFDELSSVKTTITQTASGVEQLSTSLSATNSKVTTAEAKIRNLINEVSSKVSQTDYNTLTGRVESAETAITQNASEINKRLTSTQVDKAITDKGYQTKSQVDSNITGRGYITNSALQPYALSTTVQNLVKETADSFSRTISETRGLIPSNVGTRNLLKGTKDLSGNDAKNFNTSDKYLDFNIARSRPTTGYSDTFSAYTTIPVTANDYIISFYAKSDVDGATLYCHFYNPSTTTKAESSTGYKGGSSDGLARVQVTTEWQRYWVKWSQSKTDTVKKVIIGRNNSADGIKIIEVAGVALYEGALNKGHFDAPEDLVTVTALHNVTDKVDSHTRTIGAVGETGSILDNVSKVTQTAAGLVQEVSGDNGLKTQVSTLAGSYAIKNLTSAGTVLNQINLLANGTNRIDGRLTHITGQTLIDNGVISAAKIGNLDAGKITTGTLDAARIKADSINGSKMVFDQAFVNKMTANEALFKQLFAQSAFITSVQAVAVSAKQIAGGIAKALNGGMDVNFDESKINFYTNVA
ncbi:phage tail protein, partial [Streptococcus suis]